MKKQTKKQTKVVKNTKNGKHSYVVSWEDTYLCMAFIDADNKKEAIELAQKDGADIKFTTDDMFVNMRLKEVEN